MRKVCIKYEMYLIIKRKIEYDIIKYIIINNQVKNMTLHYYSSEYFFLLNFDTFEICFIYK